MTNYVLSTNTARQDAALQFVANREGQNIGQYLNARFDGLVAEAIDQFQAQRPAQLVAAYANASAATRAQIDALLGLS